MARACKITVRYLHHLFTAESETVTQYIQRRRLEECARALIAAPIRGRLVTEIAFDYPGLGHLIFSAITSQDYFLLQGIFIFIVLGVLIANFVIDLVFISVDPRTRLSMQGAPA